MAMRLMIEIGPKLDTVFTQDAVFDLTGVGSRVCNGLDDIKAFMESEAAHPHTHMMTNVYAESDEHGVGLRFRIVALIGKAINVNWQLLRQTGENRKRLAYLSPVAFQAGRRDKRDAEVDLKGISL